MLAEPALAHRLIVRTAATIRDVDRGRHRARAARRRAHRGPRPGPGRPWAPAGLTRARTAAAVRAGLAGLMRRTQLAAGLAALGVATVATGSSALTFLFYLLLVVVAGSWLVMRLSLRGLEAGFALDRPRRRSATS